MSTSGRRRVEAHGYGTISASDGGSATKLHEVRIIYFKVFNINLLI